MYHRVGIDVNTVGGHYVFNPSTLARRRDRAVLRKSALFGTGAGRDPAALYLIGPHPEIVGKPVSKLTVPAPAAGGAFARIDQADDLQDVDPASSYVPGEITGAIEGGRPGGGRPVALALNGAIAATGRTFSLQGTPQTENFEMIVPERAFRAGRNDPELFEIVARDGGVALRALSP
jgi:hypothetical protein